MQEFRLESVEETNLYSSCSAARSVAHFTVDFSLYSIFFRDLTTIFLNFSFITLILHGRSVKDVYIKMNIL